MLEAAAPLLPDNTGGALLLGVNGVCIISHGASSATAILERGAASPATASPRGVVDRLTEAAPRAEGRRREMPAETHSHRGPVDRAELERIVREQLAEILEVDVDAVVPDARLRDDLDADDYALIELVEAVEGELGERMVGLADRRRGSRRLADGARRDRVHRRRARHARRLGYRSVVMTDTTDKHRTSPACSPATSKSSSRCSACSSPTGSLLLGSLAHRSWCAENELFPSNERLEFLGDSVLGLVVTHYVFENFPELPEGQLSEVRAGVVNARVLAEVAQEIGLGKYLLLGKGEDARGRPGEAVDPRRRVRSGRRRRLPRHRSRHHPRPRAALPRIAHRRSGRRPGWPRLQDPPPGARRGAGRSDGPATSSATRVPTTPSTSSPPCSSASECYGDGEGGSKKQAEQGAAWVAWSRLQARSGSNWEMVMPELPEVEVMRRDLEREVVGKKIKAVEVTGTRSVRRHKNRKEFIDRPHRPQDHRGRSDAGSTS